MFFSLVLYIGALVAQCAAQTTVSVSSTASHAIPTSLCMHQTSTECLKYHADIISTSQGGRCLRFVAF